MSEGGGTGDPELSGNNYPNSNSGNYTSPSSQPPTPSSTVQDTPNYSNGNDADTDGDSKSELNANSNSGLPPFSSFSAADVAEGLGGRLAHDAYLTADGTRIMELSGWDYCYTDGRYLDGRGEGMPLMIPHPQSYRPWESKQDGSNDSSKSGLPSFQSQFGEDMVTTLTTLAPAACSPAPSVPSPGLPSFHTLSAVPRYPLVPAPVQARDIPSIQQQILDERHIHLFQGAPGQNFTLQPQNGTLTQLNNGTTLTTLNNAQYHLNNAQILQGGQIMHPHQGHILGPNSQIISNGHHLFTSNGPVVVSQNSAPTVLQVVKTEPVNIVELKSGPHHPGGLLQHHPHLQNHVMSQGHPMEVKYGMDSPPRGIDGRKKERRKIRASSMESSNESDGAMSVESSGQVAAVSSTAGFKSPMNPGHLGAESDGMITDTGEKQTKKKRKRCGECIGCQRKDNCGDCAPCRNDKSHQICKMRRCEKLTEKKHLLAYNREDGGSTHRGRGRGRGRGSRGGYRGKAPRPGANQAQNSSVSSDMNSGPTLGVSAGRESVKSEPGRVNSTPISTNPALPPTMAVPFYGSSDVWPSAGSGSESWNPQGFIPQPMEDVRYQHYPGYQTPGGYQQAGFVSEQSAFQPQYGGGPGGPGGPGSSPSQGSATPRSGSYPQVQPPTPSPIGSNPPTPHVNGHRNGISVHYVEDGYVNGNSFSSQESPMVPPPSTTPASRCSSAHGASDPGDPPNSGGSKAGYLSGNDQPGYPPSSPQQQSSCNSSGYPGQPQHADYGDTPVNGTPYHTNQKSPAYNQPQPSPGYQNQNYQNYTRISPEQQKQSPSQKHGYSQSSPNKFSPAPSPSYEMYDQRQSNQYYGEFDKNNVNARIKNMIMNKQGRGDILSSPNEKDRPPNDYGGKKGVEGSENQNHFLAFSHHLREGSLLQPGGGGYRGWSEPMAAPHHNYQQYYSPYDYNQNNTVDDVSAMERFMKFASSDFHDVKPYPISLGKSMPMMQHPYDFYNNYQDPIRNLEAHYPTKREYENNNTCDYYPGVMHKRYPDISNKNYYPCLPDIKTEVPDFICELNNIKTEPCSEVDSEEEKSDSLYPRITYAPDVKTMEVVDKRFDSVPIKCEKWEEYLKSVEEERKSDENEKKDEKIDENYAFVGDGGPQVVEGQGAWCCRQGGTETPTADHLRDGCCQGLPLNDEAAVDASEANAPLSGSENEGRTDKGGCQQDSSECIKNIIRSDVPECSCFPPDKVPPEPGSYYTHLGAAANLRELRTAVEARVGCAGKAVRIEKVRYSGKEGKTTQGCPLAKWVIRRSGPHERFLAIVKFRQGHVCATAWIVVCIIAWEGVPCDEADKAYNVLAYKLNRFGLPTTRRCGTNEPRTCACQGIDPDGCGTSYSFGCSWSMYYNGCKYARSKTVRKFRLSVRTEEQEVEERMHVLATLLAPLYNTVAPEAFHNQTQFEREASECRLGFKPGRPFSGVTACVDFCAHAHRDLHNMNNGCTAVVSLTKHRSLTKPEDEQLHILPLYVMDDTDEFESKEGQEEKYRDGSVECLSKFPCEVRLRPVPLQPCRRHGKKRRDEETEATTVAPPGGGKAKSTARSVTPDLAHLFDNMDPQLQSSQVSSTVSDIPGGCGVSGMDGMYKWGYGGSNSNSGQASPLSWAGHQPRGSPWSFAGGGGYDREIRDLGDPDSTTVHAQAFSPCLQNSKANSDYSSSPPPARPSPVNSPIQFRIPKGRPPSRPSHTPDEQAETFLKPLPKDNHLQDIKPDLHSPLYQRQYHDVKPPWGGYPDDRYSNCGYPPRYPNQPYYSPPPFFPPQTEPPKAEPIGEVTDYIDNEECFRDTQMGGVGIALGHGSVLFEVAKQELHATTALRRPNRAHPTRISLVFYQHRNLNRAKHGWDEWEEKMRLRKLGLDKGGGGGEAEALAMLDRLPDLATRLLLTAHTPTTTTWTTLFPMRPCIVTGPYQEGGGEPNQT